MRLLSDPPRRSIGYRSSSLNLVRKLLLEVAVNTRHPGDATFEDPPALQQTLRGSTAFQGHGARPGTDPAGRCCTGR